MEQKPLSKWEAKVSTSLPKARADQIWPLFKDFFNLHKWFPGLSTCYGIHGVNGEPGCVRYCDGFSLSSKGGSSSSSSNGEDPLRWCKEKLISIDPTERTLSYEIIDCNIGVNSYVATIKIVPGSRDGQDGCTIEWSFAVDPVEGWKLEDLVNKYEKGLQGMAKKMEDSLEKEQEQAKPKWEGRATAKLGEGVAVEKVWPLLEDFCSINKWLPDIDTSYKLEGDEAGMLGQPGLIRYCASTIPSSAGSGDEAKLIKWCHEKLLAIDPIRRCLSYEVLDNNLGFTSYISTMKVLPCNGDGGNKEGCQIEWSFVSDPVDGWTFEGLCNYVDISLQAMAENIKKALASTVIME